MTYGIGEHNASARFSPHLPCYCRLSFGLIRKRYTIMIPLGYRMAWLTAYILHGTLFIVKGTLATSGTRRQVTARRHFGKICIRHGNRGRGLQPRSVFRTFLIIDANIQESKAFSPFLGPKYLQSMMGTQFCAPQHLR